MKTTLGRQLALATFCVWVLTPTDVAAYEKKAGIREKRVTSWLESSLAVRLGLRTFTWGMRQIDRRPGFSSRHQKLIDLMALAETRAANGMLTQLVGRSGKKRHTIGKDIAWTRVDKIVNQLNRARHAQFEASPAVGSELATMHEKLQGIQIDARMVEKGGQVGHYNLELKREDAFQRAKDWVRVLVEIKNGSSPN